MTVIPEKRETNEVNPVILPAYPLERISRPQHRVQREPSHLPKLRRKSVNSGTPRWLKFAGKVPDRRTLRRGTSGRERRERENKLLWR